MKKITIKVKKEDLPKERIIAPKGSFTRVIPNKKKEASKNACRK